MPFTFGHPAIIIPLLRKRYVSASGLIAGSMTPDFEYFFRMRMEGIHGHTFAGLFYFDLPIGLLMVVLYFSLVRDPLTHNLPAPIRERIYPFRFDWRSSFRKDWLILVLSILLGAVSHIAWDSFTHNSTILTANISVLNAKVMLFAEDYPVSHILQHVSTGVGLAIVITSFFCLPRSFFTVRPSRGFWPGILVIAAFIFSVKISTMDQEIKIGHVAVMAIAAVMYALLIVSVIYRKRYSAT